MRKYQVPKLTADTSKTARAKLVTALEAVDGVKRATLHPEQHEFVISAQEGLYPKRDEIAAAASKVG